MKAMRRNGRCVTPVLMVAALAALAAPARADDAMDARQLVEKAKLTFESVIVAPEMDALRDLMKGAKGVFVAPQVLRGAFIFGVSGGSGVFFARGERPEQWNGPAFYTIGEVSFGFQAGADASEIVLLAMTNRGVTALLSTSVKLGADASVAAGPVERIRPAVGEAREDEPVPVDIRLDQEHRAADSVQPDGAARAPQRVHVDLAVVSPCVLVERLAAALEDAVRLDDVLPGRQQPLDDVRRIFDDVHVEPQHPVLVVQRMKEQMVAAPAQHGSP